MNKNSDKYIQEIAKYFSDPNSSEHSYRTTFENYLKEIFPTKDGYFTQQDQKSIGGNKPDFIILKNKIPVLYIEVKKVGEDLDKIEKSNQADRYFGYDNLIISDYVNFRFFRNGQKYGEEISLAEINKKELLLSGQKDISLLTQTVLDFVASHKEAIKKGKHLAQIMGGKARRIRDNVIDMLNSQSESKRDLIKIQNIIKESLIHNLDDQSFADMYSQTLIYGLFAARYNDNTKQDFSRQEARDLVPKTNPFLRAFFDHIAGSDFPERLRFIVDELCEVFTHADISKLLQDFYKEEKDNKDPIIHFYEDFLKEYDAKKKMDMGVFYTPKPVVSFIIRAVDEILKNDFGIKKGLADQTKISIEELETDKKTGKNKKAQKEYHRVQVLDVATGTGTFLNEVINHIRKDFVGQDGMWESYVRENLLPRIHGFELMMASYTIAHLKLGMTLHDTGVSDLSNRLGVYLTNTLEEPKESVWGDGSLFIGLQESISKEAIEASKIKSKYPIMCVIGNPPYSGISQNKDYTDNNVYKVEPGGKIKLQEKKNWLDDDYVKFIRFAESLIEKNGSGIVGMITAHGYIDNPTFRGMRWHLRRTFDKIYIVDLHGNSNKKETSPDGSKDENVFDIKTGVSIIFGIKNKIKKEGDLSTVYKTDLFGLREEKFEKINNTKISEIKWTELPNETELWVLEGKGKGEYEKGFHSEKLFNIKSMAITTAKDDFAISFDKITVLNRVYDFCDKSISDQEIREKYKINDNILWSMSEARKKINFDKNNLIQIQYRIFDKRYTFFDENIVFNRRIEIMSHLLKNNLALNLSKRDRDFHYNFFVTDCVTDKGLTSSLDNIYTFPLYLYTPQNEKIPNLNKEIWQKINSVVGETTPENILDYIYAVLHSPNYRQKYKEFLKIDFPRVPYPDDKNKFFQLVKLGEKLRNLHLMTDQDVNNLITTFPNAGNDTVEKVSYKDGNVYINSEQYFGNVPEVAWNFYIGGYQPAQKWLKDRKGRKLSSNDIFHYQKIIVVLVETERVMGEVDEII
ncbi:MAG TPA: N-6 DNA methylase [Candidatus Paceibacterota bacterium]|nr:N-6 DNA methylase [Candidatus Paceibacterota bacterium]